MKKLFLNVVRTIHCMVVNRGARNVQFHAYCLCSGPLHGVQLIYFRSHLHTIQFRGFFAQLVIDFSTFAGAFFADLFSRVSLEHLEKTGHEFYFDKYNLN